MREIKERQDSERGCLLLCLDDIHCNTVVIFGTAGTWPSVFAPHKGSKVLDVRQCLVPRVHKAGLSMM